MGRLNLDQPFHPWRTKNVEKAWVKKSSEKIILHLHQIEKKLRQEIRDEQVEVWTKAKIKRIYG